MALEVRCPNCGSDFVLGNKDSVSNTNIKDGIAYLVPKTIRNENRTAARLEALKVAGVKVDKLQALMQGDSSLKELFDDDDPIVKLKPEFAQDNSIAEEHKESGSANNN